MKYGASLRNIISEGDVITQTAVKTLHGDDEEAMNASVSRVRGGILHVLAVLSSLISAPRRQWDYNLATGSFHYNITSCRTVLEHISAQLVVKYHR